MQSPSGNESDPQAEEIIGSGSSQGCERLAPKQSMKDKVLGTIMALGSAKRRGVHF